MEQESRVNNPKPWIAQLFCRHHGEWFRRQEPFCNLSGETQYKSAQSAERNWMKDLFRTLTEAKEVLDGRKGIEQEELIRLEELTETYPLATVARKLNRSENAVFLKRQRTGIGGFMANTDMLTRNTLSRILGVRTGHSNTGSAKD